MSPMRDDRVDGSSLLAAKMRQLRRMEAVSKATTRRSPALCELRIELSFTLVRRALLTASGYGHGAGVDPSVLLTAPPSTTSGKYINAHIFLV
jgi:hypothetical protein